MKTQTIVMLVFVMVIAACSPITIVLPTAQATLEPLPTQTVLPTYTPFPTQTPLPTYTPYPSLTPTPGLPMFTPDVAINCRLGPSTDWQVWTVVQQGRSVQVVGMLAGRDQYNYGNWLLVSVNGARCWVFGNLGSVSGNFDQVQIIAAPILSTPTPNAPNPEKITIIIKNNYPKAICRIMFFDPTTQKNTWKVNLNAGVFKSGSEKDFDEVPTGTWDVQIQPCGGKATYSFPGVEIDTQHTFVAFPH